MSNSIKTNENRDPEWRLDKLEIKFNSYGENKGKYEGVIKFENGEYESFRFKIRPNMADAYINLIAEDVVKAASVLAERLVESLGLKERINE